MTSRIRKLGAFLRENPWTVFVLLGGALAGGFAATWFEVGDLPPWGRALGGALTGAWFAMFPLGFRLFQ